ncbi:MAG: SLC13 family permease [Candidatus Hydrogenedentes bacterium]|nr:SLC13 family permease [Candidatus Hydrogenedentota bacterium]
MGWEAYLTLGVVIVIFIGLAKELAPDALLLGGAVVLAVAKIITPKEALAGFSNEGMITVAALFIVAAALKETGALEHIGRLLLGRATDEKGVIARMGVIVTSISALMNNTPVVAMMLPVLVSWCRKHRVSPSRVLIPLSYLTILGGVCTLIGTSTNIVVNGLLEKAFATPIEGYPNGRPDLHPMGLFEIAWVGVPCAIVGTLFLVFIGRRLLPERKDLLDQLGESMREYMVDMRIEPGCRLSGQRVEEAGLRHLPGLFLVELVRGEQVISPVAPDQLIEAGDVLAFTGSVSTIVDLERIPGLVPVADEGYVREAAERRGRLLSEAVVSNKSPLIGKSIRDANFRATYNAAVVAVHRGGERLKGRVGDIVLRNGDTLLLQTGPHFSRAHRDNPDFFLVSDVQDSRPTRHERSTLSLVFLAVLMALLVTEKWGTAIAALVVAGLMIATRCISTTDARLSIDWQTLITIGASFAIGTAMEKSGLVAAISGALVPDPKALSPFVVLVILYVMTNVATELISNNAAAVLMFPFAVSFADNLGVEPRPFIMAVVIAASAAFALPLGYQTHLMVYGPGGYKLGDFLRVGIFMDLLIGICALTVIPLVWRF